ncbi:PREDICTED: protein POOR HOMOLOGOUS SYNAPSIS 1-like isoform X1 [Camelina sativa]|uniref:Protein POOR HOMOLOGOUS SYNAPSIS 1-like isoform X1 n=1 Tax=Camelina sativa TaxID=90675 RepID=A0ABM1R6V5_CAMSA|nr:PREDICTED: protein POOR HOMOLOGOUS SYNAPSIS 1-like isoform X1 [Camelina sativa]
MAGSLTASVHHHRGNAVAAPEFSRWQISYARFVQFPSSPSPYPSLKPVGKRDLYYPPYGTWLSTSSSNVSLQLVDELNRSDVILSVQLGGKLLIQKFALRFSTCDAALDFVVTLKEKLKGLEEAENQRNETMCEVTFQSGYNPFNGRIRRATEEKPSMVKPLNSYVPEMQLPRLEYEPQNQKFETRSEVSFQSDYNPSDETVSRATAEEPNMGNLLDSYVPEMLPRLEYETRQTLYQPESAISRIPNQSSNNLPPSFTSLLSGCFPNSTLDAGQTTVKQDADLKSQILNYMEDSSFQDMLQKVERIMEEIGGNWIV